MSQNTRTETRGIGFAGALTLLFTGLKLTGHIDWSWWWVTSPLWGGALLFFMLFMVFATIAIVKSRKR